MKLLRRDIARRTAKLMGLNQKHMLTVLDSINDIIVEELSKGNEVEMFGLGVYELRIKAAHKGVDPRSRAEVDVPAKARPHLMFYPSARERIQRGFEERLNKTQPAESIEAQETPNVQRPETA